MKYFLIILMLLSNYSYAQTDMCNRDMEVYVHEKEKGVISDKIPITLKDGELYLLAFDEMYAFTYPIRYNQGQIYTGYKEPLSDIDLIIVDRGKMFTLLSVSVNDDKHIAIADSRNRKGPSFFHENFDEIGKIFQLALAIQLGSNCKIQASANLHTARYHFKDSDLVVDEDDPYLMMKGSRFEF